MKNILMTLLLGSFFTLTSCSSSDDDANHPYAGYWNIEYKGNDIGSIGFSIEGKGGIKGTGHSFINDRDFSVIGSAKDNGVIVINTSGDEKQKMEFSGKLSKDYSNGTWETAYGKYGTWKARKLR